MFSFVYRTPFPPKKVLFCLTALAFEFIWEAINASNGTRKRLLQSRTIVLVAVKSLALTFILIGIIN